MGIIFYLIGVSVFVALIFLIAFLWASKSGQHEDTYTPAMRILFDDGVISQEEGKSDLDSNTKETHTKENDNKSD